MPASFLDLFMAKVAIQMGLLDPPGACEALKAVDASGGPFVKQLEGKNPSPDVLRDVERFARRCLFLKGEALYLRYLREKKLTSEEQLKALLIRVRAHAERPEDDVRLGKLLVDQGTVPADVDKQLEKQTIDAVERDNDGVTKRYRERGYVGIEQNNQSVAEVVQAAAQARKRGAAAPMGEMTKEHLGGSEILGDLNLSQEMTRPTGSGSSGALAVPSVAKKPPLPPTATGSRPMAMPATATGARAMAALPPTATGARAMAAAPAAMPGTAVAAEPPPSDELTMEIGGKAGTGATPAPPPELVRTGLDDKYVVLRKLGEGGMGAVYLAYEKDDAARSKPMALKVVLDLALSKDAGPRMKREILATSMCAHENIIEIYDAAETKDGSFYMAMEYIAGEQLDEILKREGPPSIPRVVDLIEQALQGLEAVHQANIVHRDIKPQNFRIWRDPSGRERLKIMDFGIARVLDADETGAGEQFYRTMGGKITGSPAYIAPESITEPVVDQKADLYSLGITIFRVATGRLPFVAKDPNEFLPMHLYKKPPLLRELRPDAPAELEELVSKLLEKLPSKRLATATDAIALIQSKIRPALGLGPVGTEPAAAAPAPAPVPVLPPPEPNPPSSLPATARMSSLPEGTDIAPELEVTRAEGPPLVVPPVVPPMQAGLPPQVIGPGLGDTAETGAPVAPTPTAPIPTSPPAPTPAASSKAGLVVAGVVVLLLMVVGVVVAVAMKG